MSNEVAGTQAVLAGENIAFDREGRQILKDVNIAVRPGDVIALLGRNGAGKSTLFRILAGSWKPASGRVLLDGAPIHYDRKGRDKLRRKVQMVLQEPDDQIFSISVRADVSYGPVNQDLSEEDVEARVNEALDVMGISELAELVPHHLSFGQRKRVVLAGALAMRPEVLLLDEPTAGLDPAGKRQIINVVNRLSKQGTGVVLSTHDVNVAYELADTAAILVDGELILGEMSELLSDRELIRRARLELPWAPEVSRVLGRKVRRVSDLDGGGGA